MIEKALTFECEGEELVAIVSAAAGASAVGVVIVVGGPQYRVGSHRQFLKLARYLANQNIPVMRFDYRGMGDSSGTLQPFDHTEADIGAAIHAFVAACPSLKQIVLWGLCDAASASLLYWHATQDARIAGMVLLNPWIRSIESLAKAHVKHYYGPRLIQRDFWSKLLRGGVDIGGALRACAGAVATACHVKAAGGDIAGFQDRMAFALRNFAGPILLILSGKDLTAKEFLEHAQSSSRWCGLIDQSNVKRCDLPDPDHTFSRATWRSDVELLTLDWLRRSFGLRP